jgi:tetratricopeptide (TPR) repeat protein
MKMASAGKPSKGQVASLVKNEPIRTSPQQTQLDFELDFFERILERNPDFLDVLRVHGNNLTLKGRFGDGLKIDRRLVELRPKDALAHYNLACSYSLMKKVDPALRALRKAIELGYDDFEYLRKDGDLDAVKSDPRFRQLLREHDPR